MPAIKDELKSWEESGMFLSWLTSDLAWLSCLPRHMDNGHWMRASFKSIPNNWPIWPDGPNKLWGIWGISS